MRWIATTLALTVCAQLASGGYANRNGSIRTYNTRLRGADLLARTLSRR